MTMRTDGLDNPMSPNSNRTTWSDVERVCEQESVVESYTHDGSKFRIEWCDGNMSEFAEPQDAINEIQAMART